MSLPTDRPTTEDPALGAAERVRNQEASDSLAEHLKIYAGPVLVCIEERMLAHYLAGKRAGLEEAAKIAQHYGPSRPPILTRPSALILGRYEGECAASANIAEAISRASQGVKEG